MRIAPSLQRAVASFLLVLYVACVVLGGGLVRCREADGSVSLEWRGSTCCVPQSAPAAPAADVAAQDPRPDCAGCEDELFTKSLASVAVRNAGAGEIEAAKTAPDVAAVVATYRFAFADAREHARPLVRAPIPPPPLLELRSVVLRC